MNSILDVLLPSLVSGLPQIAISIVGLVLVHTRLKRFYPRAYVYSTLGLVLLLANGLLGIAITAYIQKHATSHDDAAAMATWLTLANVVGFVTLTVSMVLIVVALLADRNAVQNSRVAA